MYHVRNRERHSAAKVAHAAGGTIIGGDMIVAEWVCPLSSPLPEHLCFAKSAAMLNDHAAELRGAMVLAPSDTAPIEDVCIIGVDNPRAAFAAVFHALFQLPPAPDIAKSATIGASATLADDVAIGPNSVIGEGVTLERGVVVRANVVIGPNVRVGRNSVIKSGAIIGEEGFGYEKDAQGNNLRIPHFGSVVIGEQVEIGAGTVICGGTITPTVIEDHVKIDDLVFIAHNCRIGRNSLIIAAAEISGSVDVGENVWVGPNATIINGIKICDDAFIGLAAAVTKPITEPGIYAGNPARFLRKLS